jgi:hypothetical protein
MRDRRFIPDCSKLRESDIGSTSVFIVVGVPRRPLNSFAFANRGHRETGACPAWFSQGLISDDFGKCFTTGPSPANRQHLVFKEHVQARTRGPEHSDNLRKVCHAQGLRIPAKKHSPSRATPLISPCLKPGVLRSIGNLRYPFFACNPHTEESHAQSSCDGSK